jgi:hypothetical protein
MMNVYSLDKKHVEGVATLGEFYKIGSKSKNSYGYLHTILADDGFLYYSNGYFLIKIPCKSVPNGCYSVHSQTATELLLVPNKLKKDELPNYFRSIEKATNNTTVFTNFSETRIDSPTDIVAVFVSFCFFKNFSSIDNLRSFDEKFLKPLFKENLNYTISAVSADQIVFTYNDIIITVMGKIVNKNR